VKKKLKEKRTNSMATIHILKQNLENVNSCHGNAIVKNLWLHVIQKKHREKRTNCMATIHILKQNLKNVNSCHGNAIVKKLRECE